MKEGDKGDKGDNNITPQLYIRKISIDSLAVHIFYHHHHPRHLFTKFDPGCFVSLVLYNPIKRYLLGHTGQRGNTGDIPSSS